MGNWGERTTGGLATGGLIVKMGPVMNLRVADVRRSSILKGLEGLEGRLQGKRAREMPGHRPEGEPVRELLALPALRDSLRQVALARTRRACHRTASRRWSSPPGKTGQAGARCPVFESVYLARFPMRVGALEFSPAVPAGPHGGGSTDLPFRTNL